LDRIGEMDDAFGFDRWLWTDLAEWWLLSLCSSSLGSRYQLVPYPPLLMASRRDALDANVLENGAKFAAPDGKNELSSSGALMRRGIRTTQTRCSDRLWRFALIHTPVVKPDQTPQA
jgi:hypothetical protein